MPYHNLCSDISSFFLKSAQRIPKLNLVAEFRLRDQRVILQDPVSGNFTVYMGKYPREVEIKYVAVGVAIRRGVLPHMSPSSSDPELN
ncbi:hypothetical protein AVEN_190601-1 [Araneus ventricosus]|uniref:Uncharacterized protein n=1 Tax=Araneus ventricosus TaxID=182803 RepID=A0A4Y2CCQ8_ARAVE|nr:hypothetical protein AVEN_190601-1 [Araneus ventricosus]